MPDLVTHTLFVLPLRHRYKKALLFILLGTILPDILGRIAGVFMSGSPIIGWYQLAIHTPFCLLLFTYSLSFFFPQKERKMIFSFLLLGIASHLFLDLFQKTITLGNLWFFPFSFTSPQIHLIWPDDTIFLIPILIFINFLIYYGLNIKKYAKK